MVVYAKNAEIFELEKNFALHFAFFAAKKNAKNAMVVYAKNAKVFS